MAAVTFSVFHPIETGSDQQPVYLQPLTFPDSDLCPARNYSLAQVAPEAIFTFFYHIKIFQQEVCHV